MSNPPSLTAQLVRPSTSPAVFDASIARPFIHRSVSEETRTAYGRTIREFFAFARGIHPAGVTPALVQEYRDHLLVKRRLKANTVATKLAIVRSFFEYLKAGGVVALNPASSKLVRVPEVPSDPQGRALTEKEVRYLLAGPDRTKTEGARDYALLLLMLRLGLRLAEMAKLRTSSIKWSHGRHIIKCVVKGGREETWPLPKDVKDAVDHYLRLDRKRRQTMHSDGEDAYLFQPVVNFRTLTFDKPLSRRMIQKIVARWADYSRIGKVTPHDLRRTVVTKLLRDGHNYRSVQLVTKHRDPKTVMRYDHARENLDDSPVNVLSYDE